MTKDEPAVTPAERTTSALQQAVMKLREVTEELERAVEEIKKGKL